MDRLNQEILASGRDRRQLALLFIDFDGLDAIDDARGHALADVALKEIAQRLVANLRGSDTVARLDSNQFAIMLRDVESGDAVARVADKLMNCIRTPIDLEGHEPAIGAGIGIALFPQDGSDGDTLLDNAETVMRDARQNGGNQFRFLNPEMNERVAETHAIEAVLRRTLRGEEGEFLLHYQPQVAISGNALVGMEALIRWERPEVGLVEPESFIAVAEGCDLAGALGEWVLNQACRQNRQWQEIGLPAVPVAVNISHAQLRGDALPGMVRRALLDSGLQARYLELEINESALAQNIDASMALLRELKALGVRVTIDEFGIGYSSLSSLKRFPIDRLKIDRSFICDIASGNDNAAIAQALVAMGKGLGMKIIAEGVENIEQLRFLQQHRCDQAQGYWFSRPLNINAMAQVLANYPVRT
jgi:diguanylate cyclase (GGDEF)-like protein